MDNIGKYPVIRKLGEGATSEVFLCNDSFNARDVAVKVVSTEVFEDPSRGKLLKKLFINEASLAGKLQHPHIVQIYDAVADGKLNYIVMEYVDGGTLEKFCVPESLLSIESIVEVVFKSSRALEFAHTHGITHRDIKPANILHAERTDVKITDFGAALIATAETTQVSAIGSPAYMSPQQVKEHPLDHRTDIYSMGVVMYHLLAGRLPFQAGNNFSLIYQITNIDPPPPSSLRPEVPANVDAIVRRAMARDLDDRYPDWDTFSLDLASVFRTDKLGSWQAEFADADKFEMLRKISFFEHFTDAEIWEVAHMASWRKAAAGERLMKEGEPGDYFCILAAGVVKVTKRGKLLNLLRTGEAFGEMAYLSKSAQVRGADVTVMDDAKIISIPTLNLAQASDSCRHKFDRAFMEILVERLTMANIRLSGV
ncbi:MAG: cyclic nucleotide-binding domain-containing protein [Betaproteobacteria bacterium]|nr:cyclic nucleotide-binding domain-containing protein [Betaproteobacteria bacterium]